MDKEALKKRVCDVIDARADRLISLGRRLQACPELGYREHETARIVAEELSELQIPHRTGVAVTGVVGKLPGRGGYHLAVLGELDALELPSHPKANPETGAAHACCHHAQLVTLLGTAAGLALSGVMEELDGDVSLMAVPAEESIDGSYMRLLRESGKARYAAGKQEFLRLGELDGVDAALMTHSGNEPGRNYQLNRGWNGSCSLHIEFLGRSAHAGLSPERGLNALNAAVSAIVCINGLRETFRDEDKVRVHFVLSNGGDRVNIVPEKTVMELMVRAATVQAMRDAAGRVVRAVRGAAWAMGCEVRTELVGGYMPFVPTPSLDRVVAGEAAAMIGAENVSLDFVQYGSSTDAGDLSTLLPISQAKAGGFTGLPHASDYDVEDPYMAYVVPAKVTACSAVELLYGGAAQGREAKAAFKPLFDGKEAYFRTWDGILGDDGSPV